MRILAPAASVVEVEMLVHHGAEELYCGITPPQWSLRHGAECWSNRRSPRGGNLDSFDELARMASRASAAGVPLYLTLNGQGYTREQLADLVEQATRARDLGLAALIVADVALLLALRHRELGLPVHLSSLGTCLNASAIEFYADLGVTRVILPRQIRLDEVEALAESCPEVELEVFLLNDGCYYDEGMCSTTHALGPFCLESHQEAYVGPPSQALDELQRTHHRRLAANSHFGGRTTPRGLPLGPCGLCALPRLMAAGVAAGKIVGREGSSLRKLASLQLVRTLVEQVRRGDPPDAVQQRARALRESPELCRSGASCYYQP